MPKGFSKKSFFILIAFLFFILFIWHHFFVSGKVMVASVSSDGQYAITTDLKRMAVLWNLKRHSYKILDRKANIYSAYFIKNSNNFMWQHDTNNEVIIKNVNGKVIKKFNPGFPTYGQVITSDLEHYVAGDQDWALYLGYSDTIKKIKLDEGGFLGGQKLQNITLSSDDHYFLTAGLGGGKEDAKYKLYTEKDSLEKNYNPYQKISNIEYVLLWDVETGRPIRGYFGNVAKTFATLSPDGQYVVAGDENIRGFVWNTKTGNKLFEL